MLGVLLGPIVGKDVGKLNKKKARKKNPCALFFSFLAENRKRPPPKYFSQFFSKIHQIQTILSAKNKIINTK
jgi:hypothetical protein